MVNMIYFDPEFRETWYTKDFDKIILRYIEPYDTILFVCAGKFRLKPNLVPFEAFYLDIDPKVLRDVDLRHRYLLDAFDEKLPERIGRRFDVVVADPPYYTGYHKKYMFIMNLRKLAKRVIITKWNIIPRLGEDWELKGVYIYEGQRWWTHASIITVYTKR